MNNLPSEYELPEYGEKNYYNSQWNQFLSDERIVNQKPSLSREARENFLKTKAFGQYIKSRVDPSPGLIIEGIPVRDKYLRENWQQEGFDLIGALHATHGAFLEVGGPTDGERALFPAELLDRKLLVSNINTGRAIIGPDGEDTYAKEVDFQADAMQLPIRDKSLGCLVASALPFFIRNEAIQEASRTIEPGGILIWQAGIPYDFLVAEEFGFEVMKYHKYTAENGLMFWNVVFKKIVEQDPDSPVQ